MITFKQHLNEEKLALDTVINLIKKDCKPYLKMINNNVEKFSLWSGRSNKDEIKREIRKARNPVDTPNIVQKLVDNYFKEKFGIRFRSSSIFTLGTGFSKINLEDFGDPHLIFPIGKFSFLWSPEIEDFTFDFLTVPERSSEDPDTDNIIERLKKSKYTTKNLKKATQSGKELLISGNFYYAIGEPQLRNFRFIGKKSEYENIKVPRDVNDFRFLKFLFSLQREL